MVVFPQQPESPLAKADAELAERIRAARVATYCGQGIPVQLPWVTPVRGRGLVLDLFGGSSGTSIALAALGVRFIVVHIEHDERAAQAAKRNFPQTMRVSSVDIQGGVHRNNMSCCSLGIGTTCPCNASV